MTETIRTTLNLFNSIEKLVRKESGNNLHTINDLFYVCKNAYEGEDVKFALQLSKRYKKVLDDCLINETNTHKEDIYKIVFDVLVLESPYSFDSYFQALEYDRPVEEQFYLPRRNTLIQHGVIQALEDLLIWDKYDEMFLSMPPRVGKTTLADFVVSWTSGVKPNRTNLYCSNSGILANAFYMGVHTILSDEFTYNWKNVFKDVMFNKQTMCSAKDTWLDTGKSKRFHTFTARSIDGSLNGACDCDCLLISDDLVSGIEEALNPQRLRILWNKVNSDMLSRAKLKCKKLWIGTRWSVLDPIGIRLASSDVVDNPRVCNIVIPALDENDHSNFNYLYGVGFDDQFYINKRKSYEDSNDMASWYALYQGEPVEREGLLFNENEFRTFNGVLPETEPTRKFAYVDVAWGGGDYVAMPVLFQYDTTLYCVDWIFDKGNKKVTQPRVAEYIRKYGLTSVKFEKNNGGEGYRDDVGRLLDQTFTKCNLTTDYANNQMAKVTRIFEHAPSIKEIIFLDKEHRSEEYSRAMANLCAFTISGKNRNDDAPDSLAGGVDMANEVIQKVVVKVFQRMF